MFGSAIDAASRRPRRPARRRLGLEVRAPLPIHLLQTWLAYGGG
jgi:hypothetical protein